MMKTTDHNDHSHCALVCKSELDSAYDLVCILVIARAIHFAYIASSEHEISLLPPFLIVNVVYKA